MLFGAGFDVIGDVHGCHRELVLLLRSLGYVERGRTFAHPDGRRAVFVGDLIDRGPAQVDVYRTVRAMHEGGAALVCLGNHEWNALGWATAVPGSPGRFVREHSGTNTKQHAEFLLQVGESSKLHREILNWFRSLPLWLDLPGLRVVHACWSWKAMADLRVLQGGHLDGAVAEHDFFVASHERGSDAHAVIETLLKGIEVELPNGLAFVDKDGKSRSAARVQWWKHHPRTYQNATIVDDAIRESLPDAELLPHPHLEDDPDPRPILFGHYWAKGAPTLQSPTAACVDYSAVLGGSLVAYRWSGEQELDAANFVAVSAA